MVSRIRTGQGSSAILCAAWICAGCFHATAQVSPCLADRQIGTVTYSSSQTVGAPNYISATGTVTMGSGVNVIFQAGTAICFGVGFDFAASGGGTLDTQIGARPLTITTGALPAGNLTSSYSTTLAASGGSGTGYTWSWAAASGSSLPAGLSLSTGGIISGTPTAVRSYSIEVTVEDGASNVYTEPITLLVEPGVAAVSLTSNVAPSLWGQTVTLTATVTPSAATGTVTFSDGATNLGTIALSSGSAALTVATLAPGNYAITATYSGNANYTAGTSPALTQTVNPALQYPQPMTYAVAPNYPSGEIVWISQNILLPPGLPAGEVPTVSSYSSSNADLAIVNVGGAGVIVTVNGQVATVSFAIEAEQLSSGATYTVSYNLAANDLTATTPGTPTSGQIYVYVPPSTGGSLADYLIGPPNNIALQQGETATYPVSVLGFNGMSGTMTYMNATAPGGTGNTGLSASFGGTTAAIGGSQTLQIAVGTAVPPGTYAVQLTGYDLGDSTIDQQNATAFVTVIAAGARGFRINPESPVAPVVTAPGTSGVSFSVPLQPINGYTGTVTLAALPAASSCAGQTGTGYQIEPLSLSFSPSSVSLSSGPAAATATFNVGSLTQGGLIDECTIAFTASDGANTLQSSVAVIVNGTAASTPSPVSVSITGSMSSITIAQASTFGASISGGTGPYSYEWYVWNPNSDQNGTQGGTGSTYSFSEAEAGTYTVYLTVTDESDRSQNTATTTITVTNGSPSLTVTISGLLTPTVNTSTTLTASVTGCSGCTYTWQVGGQSPVGGSTLMFTENTPGNYLVTATANYGTATGSATATVTFEPHTQLLVTTTSLPNGITGTGYGTVNLGASGGSGGYTWSESGTLPPGLTLSSGGAISGTPSATGFYPFSVTATDSITGLASSPQSLSITVTAPAATTSITEYIRLGGQVIAIEHTTQ